MNKTPKSNSIQPPKPGARPKAKKGTLGRVIKLLFKFYPKLMPLVVIFYLFSAVTASIPAIFTKNIISTIENAVEYSLPWSAVSVDIVKLLTILGSLYLVSLIFITINTQMMAYITQGFLNKMRRTMFDGMQNLPIKFFDTHKHGDIMSHYTNDIDTLRQLVSQSLPSLLQSCVIVISVLSIMLYYSVWMTLVVLAGVIVMIIVSKKIGGGSAKHFIRMQRAIGSTEGYVQEMMNGQ